MTGIPDFQKMWDAYPRGTSEEAKKKIGGGVNSGWVTNTCAIRMSRSFNAAGHAIPKTHTFADGTKLNTTYGADKLRYAYRVREFRKYLNDQFGQPDLIHKYPGDGGPVPDSFKGKKGIIVFEVRIWSDATGHIDLWDGSDCAGHAYFGDAYEVALWQPEDATAGLMPKEDDWMRWRHSPKGGQPA